MSILSGYEKQKEYTTDIDGNHKLVSKWTNINTIEDDDGNPLSDYLGSNTDENVKITEVSVPTTDDSKIYYPIISPSASTTAGVNTYKQLYIHTSSTYTFLHVGDKHGTTGTTGQLVLSYKGGADHYIRPAFYQSGGSFSHDLPGVSGTLLSSGNTSFTPLLTSGTKIGTLTINGTATDLYCRTNTDDSVTQTATTNTTELAHPVLLSNSSNTDTETAGVKKAHKLHYNPQAGILINGIPSNYIGITSSDIKFYGSDADTWDGENESLKDALSALSDRITALGG